MNVIGIDSGSMATKAVLYDGVSIIDTVCVPTGWSPKASALEAYKTLEERCSGEASRVVATGYGRVAMDFAHKAVTEITCHGRGIYALNSKVRGVIDIGGQDSKVIALDEKGYVREFLMNDKCAAGTGRFLQNTLTQLGEDIAHLDTLAQGVDPQKISSMCTVFAESEIVSLVAGGVDKGRIASGLVCSVAERAASLFGRIRVDGLVAFTGGVSQSKAVCKSLEEKLNLKIYSPECTQYVGAVGAAVIAWSDLKEMALEAICILDWV